MMNNDLVRRALHLLSQPTERVKPQETLKQETLTQRPETGSTIEAGSCIVWTRGDGSIQTGVVDFIHVDDTGTRWAFVSQGTGWAAVNTQFTRLATTDDLTAQASTLRKATACFACGSTRQWLSIHGAIVCATCHPPAHAGLVKDWIA